MGKLSGLTYAELASRYEVEICNVECGDPGHNEGWYGGRRIHWRERGVTRSGLRRFLMLVHDATVWAGQRDMLVPRALSLARWIHQRNAFASRTALHDLGIRLDRKMAAGDRARVRHLLTGFNGHPKAQRARRWASEA